ncbi:hypothetical protein DL89DRAFT_31202 [Linderina pennispora]|uniref:Uncharacterized protein n=1 Tax=Linderina pennispora TaxID=61395 RepID=A0A1Y1W419_9FUNG|nr:uncharacterized protein DL89DRAFT_31202 [Linderina pennispora]ORX68310.1 hypothetical protein DL89DRAFT_31202 [Linderina pennispora]
MLGKRWIPNVAPPRRGFCSCQLSAICFRHVPLPVIRALWFCIPPPQFHAAVIEIEYNTKRSGRAQWKRDRCAYAVSQLCTPHPFLRAGRECHGFTDTMADLLFLRPLTMRDIINCQLLIPHFEVVDGTLICLTFLLLPFDDYCPLCIEPTTVVDSRTLMAGEF